MNGLLIGNIIKLLNKVMLKDKLLELFTLVAFAFVLVFGASLLTIAMLIILPLGILRCMFSTNEQKNESV